MRNISSIIGTSCAVIGTIATLVVTFKELDDPMLENIIIFSIIVVFLIAIACFIPNIPWFKNRRFRVPWEIKTDKNPYIDFSFPGHWLDTPFQCAKLGIDTLGGTTRGETLTEDLYLNIKAKRQLHNVKVHIDVKDGKGKKITCLDNLDDFHGDIQQGRSTKLRVMRREYCHVYPTVPYGLLEEPKTFKAREELAMKILDETSANVERDISSLHDRLNVTAIVYHSEGPHEVLFSIDLRENNGPKSRIIKKSDDIRIETGQGHVKPGQAFFG